MAIFGKRFKNETEETETLRAEHAGEEPKEGLIDPANIPLDEDGDPIRREKVLLFYNPYSGNGLFKSNLDLIIERFQANGFQVTPVRAAKGYPLDKAFDEMQVSNYRLIIAAGGDGTINVCVNAMIKKGIDLPLAIFPSGTANDFAYYFDIPDRIEEMVDVAMGNHFTYADVGVCNGRYFINVAALGSLVDVSQRTDPNLKNTLGVLSYYMKGASEIVNLKPLPVTLTTPEKVYHEKMLFMVVMNGKSAGGFKHISPDAEINDGKLNVYLFKNMPLIELGPLFFDVLQGRHAQSRKVLTFTTDDLLIESPEDISTDVDGEHGEKLPLQFNVLHNKLKIMTAEHVHK